MPVRTAQPPAARAAVRDATGLADPPRHETDGQARRRVFTHLGARRFYLVLGAVALVVAALSLLFPSTPSYDPWSWLIWGREILHLDLHTTGGPSWKPLPVMFATILAPFGAAQPDLWLVVARAGTLIAVVMVFRLAYRVTRELTGTPPRGRIGFALPPLLAAAIAAWSLVNSTSFITDNVLGYSEGLATALTLIAVDRFMDGARRQAFVIGFFAALDRPELWCFWAPYGVYLWWKEPAARRLVLGLFVLVPALWLLPELWGSGHVFRALTRAQQPRANTAALTQCPVCTEFQKAAWPSLLNRVKVAGVLGLVAAAWRLWTTRRAWWRRPLLDARTRAQAWLLAIGCFGLVWWLGISIETESGLSGNIRYVMLGTAAVAIAGGVAWGWLAGVVSSALRSMTSSRRTRLEPGVTLALGTALSVGLFLAVPPWIGRTMISLPDTHRTLLYQAHLRQDLAAAVSRAGGPAALLRCGTVMTEAYQVPMVAWTLNVPVNRVHAPLRGIAGGPWPNVILQARAHADSPLLPGPAQLRAWQRDGAHFSRLAHARTFTVLATCPAPVASSVGVR